MIFISKNNVAELNKEEKLNEDGYEIWSMKIQYVLEKKEVLKVLNLVLETLEEGNLTQRRRDHEAYDDWRKNNSTTQII